MLAHVHAHCPTQFASHEYRSPIQVHKDLPPTTHAQIERSHVHSHLHMLRALHCSFIVSVVIFVSVHIVMLFSVYTQHFHLVLPTTPKPSILHLRSTRKKKKNVLTNSFCVLCLTYLHGYTLIERTPLGYQNNGTMGHVQFAKTCDQTTYSEIADIELSYLQVATHQY